MKSPVRIQFTPKSRIFDEVDQVIKDVTSEVSETQRNSPVKTELQKLTKQLQQKAKEANEAKKKAGTNNFEKLMTDEVYRARVKR
jgi:hypothetical protein